MCLKKFCSQEQKEQEILIGFSRTQETSYSKMTVEKVKKKKQISIDLKIYKQLSSDNIW